MRVSKFDPWNCPRSSTARAYRAYSAYPAGGLGTLGAIGTVPGANLSTKCREWDCQTDASGRVANMLRTRLTRPSKYPARFEELRLRALTFCASHWMSTLLRLEWTEADFFAVDLHDSRQGGLVQALDGGTIRAATSSVAAIVPSDATSFQLHSRSCLRSRKLKLIWELEDS
jgi:hypothetical protein